MFNRLFSLSRKRSQRRNTSTRKRRLTIENLEGRALLAVYNWVLQGDGDWGVAGNWNNTSTNLPGVPGATDTANIGQVQVTSGISRTVNNITGAGAIKVTAGTFSVQNAVNDTLIFGLTVDAGATFRTTGGTTHIINSEISGTLNTLANGTLRFLRGLNTLNPGSNMIGAGQYLLLGDVFGAPFVELNQDMVAPANFRMQNGTLGGSGDLTVNGILEWNATNGVSMTGTGLTIIQPSATLNITGLGGSIDGRTINNSGSILFSATSDLVLRTSGTINNLAGSTFEIQTDSEINGGVEGFFNNSGTIEKTAGGGTTQLRTILTNTGTIDVQTGTIAFFAGQGTGGTYKTSTGAFLDLTGGSGFSLTGTNTFQGTGTVFTGSGQLNILAPGATWVVPATTTMLFTSSVFVIPVGATLTYNGNLSFPASTDAHLKGGGRLLMNGNFTHSGAGNIIMFGDVATNSIATTLEIPATRNLTIQSDGGITGSGASGIIKNAGTIQKTGGTGTSLVFPNISNTGIIKSTVGTLMLHKTTTAGGTLTAGTGAAVKLTDNFSGQFLMTGTMVANGSGSITFGAGNFVVGASGGTLSVGATTQFIWSGGNWTVPVSATLTVNGNFIMSAAATVILGGGGTMVFNGNVTHSGDGDLRVDGDGGSAPTTMRLASGKNYNFASDGSVLEGFFGGGTFDNLGLIRKSAGAGASSVSVDLAKPANLQVDSGTLRLAGNGHVIIGGNFQIAAGAVVDLVGVNSDIVTYSGTFTGSGAGRVQLNRGILLASNATGVTFNFPSGLFEWFGGNIDTNSSVVTMQGSVTFAGAAGVFLVGQGTLQVNGTFEHTSTGNLSLFGTSTLAIGTTGVYNMRKNAAIVGSGSLENAGIFRKNGGTGVATVSTPVTNTGTIESRLGTLKITGNVSEIVSGTLTGGIWGAFSTATNTAAMEFNNAVSTIGLAATVKLSGPNSSLPSIGGLANVVGNFQLLAGANYANSGDLSNSGNILVSPTSVLDVSGILTHATAGNLTIQLAGAIIGRVRTLGTANLGGSLTITFTGAPPASGTAVTILENQSALPINGTFAGLAQNAVMAFGGMTWRIRYNQGSGNDVVLQRLA